MSRGITSRKDAISVLSKCLIENLASIDYWTGSFDIPDEAIAKFLEARIAVRQAVLLVGEAEALIPDEER